MYFFAIATSSVNGHFLRGDKDQRTLDVDDNVAVRQLSFQVAPADLVNDQNRIEKLVDPRQLVPKDPVEPVDTVAMNTTSPELYQADYVYNICEDYLDQTGDDYVLKNTTKISVRLG